MFHVAGFRRVSSVWLWGKSSTPSIVATVPGLVTSLASGIDHSGYVADGKVWTFGSNKFSQLGRSTEEGAASSPPAILETNSIATGISCGAWHSVCCYADGSVSSFGWGGSWMSGAGGLGLGSKASSLLPTRVIFPEKIQIVQVACGNQHTLFLTDSGSVWATGHGAYGILGTGDSGDELLPVELSAIPQSIGVNEKVVKIATGGNFSALLTNTGNMYVWGRNDSGQLGLGEESQGDMHSAERYPRSVPFFEKSGIAIRDIACGENHMVALTQNGALYYWGDRAWLEPHLVSLPEANGGIAGVLQIAAGSKYSLALTTDGLLFGWSGSGPAVIAPAKFGNQKVLQVSAHRNRFAAVTSGHEFVATSDQEAEQIATAKNK